MVKHNNNVGYFVMYFTIGFKKIKINITIEEKWNPEANAINKAPLNFELYISINAQNINPHATI
jgi:hypothetical protein